MSAELKSPSLLTKTNSKSLNDYDLNHACELQHEMQSMSAFDLIMPKLQKKGQNAKRHLSVLDAQSRSHSLILTKRNSITWDNSDLIQYENELQHEMRSMSADFKSIQSTIRHKTEKKKSKRKKHKKRNSNISLSNCHQWSIDQMKKYQKELKTQRKGSSKRKSHHRRHSNISLTNCDQWNFDEINHHETELIQEIKRLQKTFR